MMTVRFGRGSVLFLLAMVAGADLKTCYKGCSCSGIRINCSKTELTNIPFSDIKGANIVDVSGNDIEEIDFAELKWKGIEQLQYLFFNVNSIVYINENAFEEFMNLEYVDLSDNLLDYLPSRIFESNARLTTLILAGNHFGNHAPELISTSITSLDLSFCKLDAFTIASTRYLPQLQHLNLQANALKYFPMDEFKETTIEINLMYNKWSCNCSTIELSNWTRDKTIRIERPIMCMTKSQLFIDLFDKVKHRLQKETCVIDPDTFEPSIKKYSLTANTAKTTHQESAQSSNKSLIIIVSTITFTITATLSATIGYILILYVHKRSKRNEHPGSEHLLMEGRWV